MLSALVITLALMAQQAEASEAYAQLGSEARERLMACEVNAERFGELMRLEHNAFDQDMDGGWRAIARHEGCEHAAADLLVAYMDHSVNFDPARPGVIDWHAGQLLAVAGETEQAIPYFEAKRVGEQDWVLYVDASLAFLRRDRAAAEAARAELAQLRPSQEMMAARRQFLADNPQITMPKGFVEEPQNLSVVDRLLACWDMSYADAYSGACLD